MNQPHDGGLRPGTLDPGIVHALSSAEAILDRLSAFNANTPRGQQQVDAITLESASVEFVNILAPVGRLHWGVLLARGAVVFKCRKSDLEDRLRRAQVLVPLRSALAAFDTLTPGAALVEPLRAVADGIVQSTDPRLKTVGPTAVVARLTALGVAPRQAQDLLDAALADARAQAKTGAKPTIAIGAQLPVVVDAALEALAQWNTMAPTAFNQDGTLVRVRPDRRQPRIEPFTPDALMDTLSRASDWIKQVSEEVVVDVWPPRIVCNVILDQPSYGDKILPLRALYTAPFFTSEGRLVQQAGYHADAAVYLATSLQVPPVSPTPSAAEVEIARQWMVEPFCDFIFADGASLAHCVALLILPFAREFIGLTPVHVITGPDFGIGKDLITQIVGIVATGKHVAPLTGTGRDEDELRKLATSVLREGRSIAVFSNVSDRIDSRVLASTFTAESVSDRLLGGNKMIDPMNRCTWLLTGVNVEVSAEMARRAVAIRIDPETAEPHRRTNWRHTPLDLWVRENRTNLVWSSLTLIAHWLAEGRPLYTNQTLGSFESWCQVIGGILQASRIDGFLQNIDVFTSGADMETAEAIRFISMWWHQHRSASVGIGSLVDDAGAAMPGIVGPGGDRARATKLGRWLSSRAGKVFKILEKDGQLLQVRIERRDDVRDSRARRVAGFGLVVLAPRAEKSA